MKIIRNIYKNFIQKKERMFGKLNNFVTHDHPFSHVYIKYRIYHYQQKIINYCSIARYYFWWKIIVVELMIFLAHFFLLIYSGTFDNELQMKFNQYSWLNFIVCVISISNIFKYFVQFNFQFLNNYYYFFF